MLISGCGIFDIRGVCTEFGASSPRQAAAHASFLLGLCAERCPVIAGSERPILVRRKGKISEDCSVLDELSAESAVPAGTAHPWDLIYRTAVETGGELELFCTGPLTNIAVAVIRHRDLPKYIKRITIAGGASRRGNATPYAEYNIYNDPHAFKCILDAGFAQVDLVDLEFCRTAHLTTAETEGFRELPAENPWKDLFERTVGSRLARDRHTAEVLELDSYSAAVSHDAAAAFVLAIPAAITFSGVYTMVELRSETSSGRTLFDFGKRFTDDPNVRLAVYTSREMFSDFYFRCLHTFDRR